MRAMLYRRYGDASVIEAAEWPVPEPGAGEVRVKVACVGVNPLDWKLRHGHLRLVMRRPMPFIPMADFSGTIDALGPGVTTWHAGQAVCGMVMPWRHGAAAEYVIAKTDEIAPLPAGYSFASAAGLPMAALTAWRGLFTLASLKAGERVLVRGASGGVGLMAVQLAKLSGASVVGVCSAKNAAFVRALGADEVLAYDERPLADAGAADVFFDATGGWGLRRAWPQLTRGGRYVATLPAPSTFLGMAARPLVAWLGGGRRGYFFLADKNEQALSQLVEWAGEGLLRVPVARRYPLAELAAAQEESRSGRVVGKLIIDVA